MIPLGAPTGTAPAPGRPAGQDRRRRVVTVLVAEPDPLTRQVLRLTLELGGYRVQEASTGREAFQCLAEGRTGLVLQNLFLPDADSCRLARVLRSLPGCHNLPVLLYSENLAYLLAARRSGAGVSGYLVQPFMPSHLLRVLATHLRAGGLPPGAPLRGEPGRVAEWTPAARPGRLLRPRPRVLVAEDNPALCYDLADALEGLGLDVLLAEDGPEALEQALRYVPDVLVCDTLLTGMDGFELCLAVRRDPRLAATRVVLSPVAYADEWDRQVARAVGADALVPRQVGCPDAAVAVVERLAGASSRRTGARPTVEPVGQPVS